MKKFLLGAVALVAVLGMGACQNQKNCDKNCDSKECSVKGDKKQLFTGVVPAADAAGVRYTLKLDFDDDDNYTTGDYDLVETYLAADSVSSTGSRDDKSFKSEGDFSVMQQDGKSYLKLVQDKKDSSLGSNEGPLYFLVDSDSTLTMVNSNLEVSANPALNYTLKLVK